MSSPQTNLKTQRWWHRGPLIGMSVGLIFVAGLFLWWVTYEVAESDPPQGSEVQIDGRTGEPVLDETLNEPGDGEPADFAPAENVPGDNPPSETVPTPVPVEPVPAE